jgi:enoyl-CoA hydratase/carnithine racemase
VTHDFATLELSFEDRCAWVTLNRPERLNALVAEMYADLDHCADCLAMDSRARVVCSPRY